MSDKTLLFSVVHQKVAIDVDLYHRVIYGSTELTVTAILPNTSSKDSSSHGSNNHNNNNNTSSAPSAAGQQNSEKALPRIAATLLQLHSRGCVIQNVMIDGVKTLFYLSNEANPISNSPLVPPEFTTQQSELIRKKLDTQLSPYPPGDLFILLPVDLLQKIILSSNNSHNSTNTPAPDGSDTLNSFTIKIDYSLQDSVNGFNFVGGKNSKIKKQYWHAYTTHNPIGLATSSWVPCFDGFWDQCSWQFEISIPRRISDMSNFKSHFGGDSKTKKDIDGDVEMSNTKSSNEDSSNNATNNEDDDDEVDDPENRDILVVCAEYSPKEIPHPFDPHRKIVCFDISTPMGAQNVGFAIGPFDSVSISDPALGDNDEDNSGDDEEDEENKIPLTVYALPDKINDAQNTCVFLFKTMEYFSRDFGSFPFNSMSFCFVSQPIAPYASSAGVCICDDSLLYPPDVIEPLFVNPEILSKALATQWSGVALVPKSWNDIWVTNGIAGYMAQCFIRKLMGSNEYRFILRKRTEEICHKDIGMPPLGDPHFDFPLTHRDLSFISLKAPVVLFILDRRMTKTEKSLGLSRAIPKIFIQSVSGDLTNSCLSTAHFIKVCERVSHSKLDSFFNQWVYGSGYPIFRVTQKFNKKRMFIEMGIRQVQASETVLPRFSENDFVKRARHDIPSLEKFPVQPVFTVSLAKSDFCTI